MVGRLVEKELDDIMRKDRYWQERFKGQKEW